MDLTFRDDSRKVLEAMEQEVLRALEACGLTAEGYAKKECPVDTGRLRNSIAHALAPEESAVYIGTNVEYGPYVELGTRRQRAQPFLRPAVADHVQTYTQIIRDTLKSG